MCVCSLQVNKDTALTLATVKGRTEIVQALVTAPGIDVNQTNVRKNSLAHPVPCSSWG